MKFNWLSKVVVFLSLVCVAAFFADRNVPWLLGSAGALSMIILFSLFFIGVGKGERKREIEHRLWVWSIVPCVWQGPSFLRELMSRPSSLDTALEGVGFAIFALVLWLSFRIRKREA
jgi:hypothetical protein